jgi:hypothetical protein
MKCPTCAESMQPGTIETTPGLVGGLLPIPIVSFTREGGGHFQVLRAGRKARAYYCKGCELIVFAHEQPLD